MIQLGEIQPTKLQVWVFHLSQIEHFPYTFLRIFHFAGRCFLLLGLWSDLEPPPPNAFIPLATDWEHQAVFASFLHSKINTAFV